MFKYLSITMKFVHTKVIYLYQLICYFLVSSPSDQLVTCQSLFVFSFSFAFVYSNMLRLYFANNDLPLSRCFFYAKLVVLLLLLLLLSFSPVNSPNTFCFDLLIRLTNAFVLLILAFSSSLQLVVLQLLFASS